MTYESSIYERNVFKEWLSVMNFKFSKDIYNKDALLEAAYGIRITYKCNITNRA